MQHIPHNIYAPHEPVRFAPGKAPVFMMNMGTINTPQINVQIAMFGAILEMCGAQVVYPNKKLEDDHPQKVFLRDRAFFLHDKNAVLISNDPTQHLKLKETKIQIEKDTRSIEKLLRRHGAAHQCRIIRTDAFFEGGNLLYFGKKGIILQGVSDYYIEAGNAKNKALLQDTLTKIDGGLSIHTIQMLNQGRDGEKIPRHTYHVDLVVGKLSESQIMLYKNGLAGDVVEFLEAEFGRENIVYADRTCQCNIVTVGNSVVLPNASESVRNQLVEKGYNVISSDRIYEDAALRNALDERMPKWFRGFNNERATIDEIVFDRGTKVPVKFNTYAHTPIDASASIHCLALELSKGQPLLKNQSPEDISKKGGWFNWC